MSGGRGGSGMDFVLPSDYDKLVVARQQELAYIAEVLARCDGLRTNADQIRREISDLRGWLQSRRTCHPIAAEPSTPPSVDKAVWLIERTDLPMWLMPGLPTRWTNNAAYAIRCATEDEASAIIRHPDFHDDLHGLAKPTEHVLVGSANSGSSNAR